MVGILFAALLAGAPIAPVNAAPSISQGSPAMWMVHDDDTTIYLFGTFHALDGRTHWFDNQIRNAFTSSDELVLETLIPRRQEAVRPFRSSGRAIGSLSVTPGASFVASTQMAVSVGRDSGMQVSKGADMVLRDAAEFEGKAVQGLESLEFQFGMFNSMARAPTSAIRPMQTPQARAQLATVMMQMQSAWKAGDQRIFASLLSEMRRTNPVNYRVMFPQRNANWARWIADRMDRPGTVFVAVGAGHFVGPDSVQSQLTLKGLVATRVN